MLIGSNQTSAGVKRFVLTYTLYNFLFQQHLLDLTRLNRLFLTFVIILLQIPRQLLRHEFL